MRTYAGAQGPWWVVEFDDSAEDFRELFLGVPGETGELKAIRQEIAREVLLELEELGQHDAIAQKNAFYAQALSAVTPLWSRAARRATAPDTKEAA